MTLLYALHLLTAFGAKCCRTPAQPDLCFSFRRFGFGGVALGIFAAEALDAAGGIHELLLAGKEGMTGGADFDGDVALVSGAGNKGIAAGAMDADFAVVGMN